MTEELEVTEEQRHTALGFSRCLVTSMVTTALTQKMGMDDAPNFFEVDHSMRHSLEENGFDPNDKHFGDAIIEYGVFLYLQTAFDNNPPKGEYEKLFAFVIGSGVASVLNLHQLPVVGVVPNMSDDFGVPPDWVAEFGRGEH